MAHVFNESAVARRQHRLREVLTGIVDDIKALSAKIQEQYVRSDEFEDLLDHTLRRVANERHEEKRRLYREFLLDAMTTQDMPYDERLRMVRTIDELQAAHIRVITAVLTDPRPASGYVSPPYPAPGPRYCPPPAGRIRRRREARRAQRFPVPRPAPYVRLAARDAGPPSQGSAGAPGALVGADVGAIQPSVAEAAAGRRRDTRKFQHNVSTKLLTAHARARNYPSDLAGGP